jgi:hypothetical protein
MPTSIRQFSAIYQKLSSDFAKLVQLRNETCRTGFAFNKKEEDNWSMRRDAATGAGYRRCAVPRNRGGDRQ